VISAAAQPRSGARAAPAHQQLLTSASSCHVHPRLHHPAPPCSQLRPRRRDRELRSQQPGVRLPGERGPRQSRRPGHGTPLSHRRGCSPSHRPAPRRHPGQLCPCGFSSRSLQTAEPRHASCIRRNRVSESNEILQVKSPDPDVVGKRNFHCVWIYGSFLRTLPRRRQISNPGVLLQSHKATISEPEGQNASRPRRFLSS